MSFYFELKRRNVLRVAVAYLTASWLLIQVADTVFPVYGLGNTALNVLITVLAIGFPLCLLFSWIFEFTPEGLRRETEIDRAASITHKTGRQLDRIIIALLALALAYFAFDRFVLVPAKVAEIVDKYTARVGTLMLHKWNFQEEMVEVVRSRKDWMRDKSEQADLADIVLLARLHSYVGTPHMRRHPPLYKTPAFKKLGLDKSGPQESIEALSEARKEITEIKQLLPMPEMPVRKRSKLL